MNIYILWALLAGIGTWGLTLLGSAIVLFFKSPKQKYLNIMLGFSAGVMIAASFWSLLQPAIERAEESLKIPSYIVVSIGFSVGSMFVLAFDKMLSKTIFKANYLYTNNNIKRVILLIISITLHNIPEGLAVGVAFGMLKQNNDASSLMSAILIAIGIGIQNFPEGAAVSLPLRREGLTRKKSFFYGQLSAVVEPIAAVIGATTVSLIVGILPYALAFAAGAMIFVAVHELIPNSQNDDKNYSSTIGIMCGFIIMMLLDVMLG